MPTVRRPATSSCSPQLRSRALARPRRSTGRAALAVALLLSGLPPASSRARADDLFGKDKALHLSVSFALGSAAQAGLWLLGNDPRPVRLGLGFGLALLPGLAKEIWDAGRPGNHFSGLDLLWDAVGAALGNAAVLGLDLLLARRRAAATRSAPRRVSLGLALSPTGIRLNGGF
jgi:uncharacterized protein YfiM (DUF2279 family)